MKSFRWFLLLIPGILFGQDYLTPRSSLAVNFDYARFAHSDSTQYLELYFACFPPLVTLAKDEGGYKGYVELRTEIRNKMTGTYAVRNRSLLTVSAKDTADPSFLNTLVTQMGYILPEGEFVMDVTAIDTLAPTRRDSLSVEVTITGRRNGSTGASDVELCSMIKRSEEGRGMFYKNSYDVIPNPTLLFGTANHPVIYHYAELYGLDPEETYVVKSIIADVNGTPIQENSKKRKFGVENAVEVGTINAVKLPSGKYKFQLYVLTQSSQPVAKAEKNLFIYNPQTQTEQVSAARMKETELSGLTAEELDLEFAYLRYHSTDPEIKLYSQITSVEGKREFLGAFWNIVENGKMGRDPISRQEYLDRVKKASERYRAFNREGWRTDRGRVYILYGEADEIERKPSVEEGKPFEVWHYYQIENGVQFVFIDRTGFGEYILVHSTKRGELRDDMWRRLLQ